MGVVYKSIFNITLYFYIFKTKPKKKKKGCYCNTGPFYLRRIDARKNLPKVNLFKMDENLENFEWDFILKNETNNANKLMLY